MFKIQPTAIVWDLDGTLVDSAPDLASALNATLSKRGFFTLPLEQVRPMIGNGVPKLVERGFNAVGMRPEPVQLAALVELFAQEYANCATDRTRPYPGIIEALEALSQLDLPMGVCTNKPVAFTRQILKGLGMEQYFSSVIGGDSTAARKPDPEPVLACLGQMLATPSLSVMIGDSVHDVRAARAAGTAIGVVPWGYRTVPAKDMGADFVLDDARLLPGWVREAEKLPPQTAH
jgi:phosphoglycolate phosphatase